MLALACLIVLPFMTEAKTLLVETKSIVKPPIRPTGADYRNRDPVAPGYGASSEEDLFVPAIPVYAIQNKQKIKNKGNCDKGSADQFVFMNMPMAWDDARVFCEKTGGWLAQVKDGNVNKHLADISKGARTWLGGTDQFKQDKWIWINDRSDITYFNWTPEAPNNYGGVEHCLETNWMPHTREKWNDDSCLASLPFICQYW